MVDLWLIEGYDSTTLIFSLTLPFSRVGEIQIADMLQRLAARHLTGTEIVEASLRPRARTALLDVHRSGPSSGGRWSMSAGTNPHYIASIIRSHELAEFVERGTILKPGAKPGIKVKLDGFLSGFSVI